MYLPAAGLVLSSYLCATHALDTSPGPSYEALPTTAAFPGPWDAYIQAPANKSYIVAKQIWKIDGDASVADVFVNGTNKPGLTMGPGGLITLEFPQNIAGRYVGTSRIFTIIIANSL